MQMTDKLCNDDQPRVPFERAREFVVGTQRELRKTIFQELNREGGMSHQRVFLYGIAKRTLANAHAFMAMQDAMNATVAAALVRLQLDTLLRLYALWWVDDADVFAKEVWSGKQINRMKAADGAMMSDAYLADRLSAMTHWIPTVYRETSGFIHFSHRHVKMVLMDFGDSGAETAMNIEALDLDRDPVYLNEIAAAFADITMQINIGLQFRFEMVDMLGPDEGLGCQCSRS